MPFYFRYSNGNRAYRFVHQGRRNITVSLFCKRAQNFLVTRKIKRKNKKITELPLNHHKYENLKGKKNKKNHWINFELSQKWKIKGKENKKKHWITFESSQKWILILSPSHNFSVFRGLKKKKKENETYIRHWERKYWV